MADISTLQARGIFTSRLIAVYQERVAVTAFLRSFFPEKTSNSKLIKIAVIRGFEKIAVDVQRGMRGNRNSFDLSSEKTIKPPYFHEYFDATELDLYDLIWNTEGSINVNVLADFIRDVADKVLQMIMKIERAYEVQCRQALHTGIVTLNDGSTIDYKRKAASLVAYTAGNDFSTGSVDPNGVIEIGAEFIRTKGKSQGGMYNTIMGKTAFAAYKNNTIIKETANLRRFQLIDVRLPQKQSTGATLHGVAAVGSYETLIWTYPEFYDIEGGAENNPYINPKDIIVMPENPNFDFGFASVPKLLAKSADAGTGIAGQRGAFLVGETFDQVHTTHNIDVKSAGVPVLTAVDQVWTATVIS